MPGQLFAAGLQTRDIYPELKIFLQIDTHSSTDSTLHGSGRTVEKNRILRQIEKLRETSNTDLTC